MDHVLDPAWEVVGAVQRELGLNDLQLERQELRERERNCGLKCSALRQAICGLPAPSAENDTVIVTVDSDAVPGPDWLCDLLRPLEDPQVGAATSNQWFQPETWAIGSWVRSVWQAGAIVPTAILANPWAGSFAIRHSDLISSGLLEEWRRSIVDDGPVRECLQSINKQVAFVPQNMVINREDCRLSFCFRYMARMLTWSRLFETTFWITCLHALVTLAIQMGVGIWLVLATLAHFGWFGGIAGGWGGLSWALTAATSLVMGQLIGYFVIQNTVRALSSQRPRSGRNGPVPLAKRVSWVAQIVLVAVAIPLTTLAYVAGCLFALSTKRIVWRNVAYEIEGGRQVEMVHYAPYHREATQSLEHHSI